MYSIVNLLHEVGMLAHIPRSGFAFLGLGKQSVAEYSYRVASREIDRIQADIIVKGPANKLGISFRSNPPFSQREVLSYILFNRGISDITSNQGDLLSQSFIELNSGEQTQTDFLSRLRSNIGIDRLDLTASDGESKDMALQIGKYISEKVFVSMNTSLTDATSNRVAIEAKLPKNLKAQAEVGLTDAQGKILLKIIKFI